MIRVVLADDEAMIRAGIRSILATDPGIEVVAEAADGRAAVDLVRAHRPGIALLDIRMPRMDGLSAAAELRVAMPGVAVIMLTTFDEDEYVARALAGGAAGFLLKASDPRELLIGVRAVADGGAYLSPRIARKVITRLTGGRLARADAARAKVQRLTPRERDVLALVGRGLSNQDIGLGLSLSEGTVKAHVSAILLRLGLSNRVQAAIVAYEADLIGGDLGEG
ncbi:response regulator [Paractinoplanes maris]|uniref:response regulator n=1 Tax=Paractinoplanes maris TaxID=1734446 RepID=UPI002020F53A|nr:response regulator transcription factor [Actinoplanes maris]